MIFSKISVQKLFKKTSCQDKGKNVLLQDHAGERGGHSLFLSPYFTKTGKSCRRTVLQPGINVLLKRSDCEVREVNADMMLPGSTKSRFTNRNKVKH